MSNESPAKRSSKNKVDVTCAYCGDVFFINKKTLAQTKREGREVFCSSSCRSLSEGLLVKGLCSSCHKEVIRQKSQHSDSGAMYCSRSCAAKINNALYVKRIKNPEKINKQSEAEEKKARLLIDKCDQDLIELRRQDFLCRMRAAVKRCTQDLCACGGIKRRESNRCKTCAAQDKALLTKAIPAAVFRNKDSVTGKHPSWKNSHIRNQCRSWNKDLAKLPCQKCGYSLHVELCHTIPVSSFSEDTTLGEINDPANILVLCSRDHWEFDHGHLPLEDIPMREGQTSRTSYKYNKR